MTIPEVDRRSLGRRERDDELAMEPQLPPLEIPYDTTPLPMEAHLSRRRRPLAVAGVVENGLVRLLDPTVKLPESSRVIVVTSETT